MCRRKKKKTVNKDARNALSETVSQKFNYNSRLVFEEMRKIRVECLTSGN